MKSGWRGNSLTNITDPDIGWVKLSEGMGVPAVSVETTESLAFEIKRSLDEKGPHLIEMVFT